MFCPPLAFMLPTEIAVPLDAPAINVTLPPVLVPLVPEASRFTVDGNVIVPLPLLDPAKATMVMLPALKPEAVVAVVMAVIGAVPPFLPVRSMTPPVAEPPPTAWDELIRVI